jgi:hypothetical protein
MVRFAHYRTIMLTVRTPPSNGGEIVLHLNQNFLLTFPGPFQSIFAESLLSLKGFPQTTGDF